MFLGTFVPEPNAGGKDTMLVKEEAEKNDDMDLL